MSDDTKAWLGLKAVVDRLAQMQKLRNAVLCLLILTTVFFIGQCQGRGEGKDSQADKVLQQEIKAHDKAVKMLKDSISITQRRLSEQEARRTKADSIVRDSRQTELRTRRKYELLRDSVLSAPRSAKDTTLRRVIASADSALDAAKLSASAKDSAITARDSVIASLRKVVVFQGSAISERESQISALNKRLEISAKRIGRARREGFYVGTAVGIFAVMAVKSAIYPPPK